jgi:hypothetical protein
MTVITPSSGDIEGFQSVEEIAPNGRGRLAL